MENTSKELKRPEWLVKLHDWRVANVSDKMFLLILVHSAKKHNNKRAEAVKEKS